MKKISFICLLGLFLVISLSAETTVNFNDINDMDTYFNNPNPTDLINISTGGIGISGAVQVAYLDLGQSRVVTYKTGFSMGAVDVPITISAYFRGVNNGGYAGLGFSSASTNVSSSCRINNVPALGMRYYSSGASLFNNQDIPISDSYSPDIPLSWYKVVYRMIPRGADVYDVSYQLFQSDASGTIGLTPTKSGSHSFTNTTIDDGLLYPYFAIDGHRVTHVDNFYFNPAGTVTYDFPEGGLAVNIPGTVAGNTLQF